MDGGRVSVCIQCHKRFIGGYRTTTKEGYELLFCTLKCGQDYRKDYGKGYGKGRRYQDNFMRQGSGNQRGPIYFYQRGEPYYELTNFYEAVVHIDDQDWLTTVHYYHAQKFVGTPLVGGIRLLEQPCEAFDMSRDPSYSHWIRIDWEQVKENIMLKALHAKFTQHIALKNLLLGTGDRQLVLRSPNDSYWGDGGDGSGKNRLGILLMRLRALLSSMPAYSH